MNEKIKELKELGSEMRILYVEDNLGLRANIEQLLGKIFPHVLIAADGLEGYQAFKEHRPQLVIADINMPKLNGLQMARKIRLDDPDAKIICMTAYDDKEHLLEAINVGVFRYIPKPAKVNDLVDALYDTVIAIRHEEHKRLFHAQLNDIFNYQNNLLIMFQDTKPVIVNQRFLDFFGVENLQEFTEQHPTLDNLLKPHQHFLYSTEARTWYEAALNEPAKLFHTKINDHNDESRHLIMKLRPIPDKKGATIVSFDDVTELNLLELFDKDAAKQDKSLKEKKTVLKFLNIVRENNAEVKLYNHYRGLTITNTAIISEINEEQIVMKSAYAQLKAIQISKQILIHSEIFPAAILCNGIESIDFDKQTVTFSEMQFVPSSAIDRENIRLEPDNDHTVTLLYDGRKFFGECKIIDLSINSVRLGLNQLPPGIDANQEMRISVVLPTSTVPLNLNILCHLFLIDEQRNRHQLVLRFEIHGNAHKGLLDYLSNRQMALIREFKSMGVPG